MVSGFHQFSHLLLATKQNPKMSLCQFCQWSLRSESSVLVKSERIYLEFMAREAGIRATLSDEILLTIQSVLGMDPVFIENFEGSLVKLYATKHLQRQHCLSLDEFFGDDGIIKSLVHIWTNLDVPMVCYWIILVFEYYVTTAVMPNQFELFCFLNNRQRMHDEPEEYCKEENQDVPTPGLTHMLPSKLLTDDKSCSICLSDIAKGSSIVTLPQCGHVFHWDKKECLQEACIVNWLEKSRFCPNCKTPVSFPQRSNFKKRKRNTPQIMANDKILQVESEDEIAGSICK
jgi:hypothetical protein